VLSLLQAFARYSQVGKVLCSFALAPMLSFPLQLSTTIRPAVFIQECVRVAVFRQGNLLATEITLYYVSSLVCVPLRPKDLSIGSAYLDASRRSRSSHVRMYEGQW